MSAMGEESNVRMLGFLVVVAFFYGIVQVYAGCVGIADAWGPGWAGAALVALVIFRFSLPLTVGAFLCARDVWDWSTPAALVFAMPGLVFLVPGEIRGLWHVLWRRGE